MKRRQAIARRSGDGPAPLSFQQEQLWVVDQLVPGTSAYTLPVMVRLDGPLDVRVLDRTLTEIVRRHESLRTRLPLRDGRPVQVVEPPAAVTAPVADLGSLPEDERRDRQRRLVAAAVREPFDLARGPLLRATLLRLGPGAHRLLLLAHHAVADAWSQQVLIRELAAIYSAFAAGEPSPLPEPPIQYADFAAWQRARFEEPAMAEHLRYWRERLRPPLPVLELPADRPRPPVPTFRGTSYRRPLPDGLLDALSELSRRARVSLYMTLLAAFTALLHRYGGQDDVVLGTTAAGRDRVELQELVGFFANTLVLRVDLGGDPTFSRLLGRVRETVLEALDHGEAPLSKVIEAVRPSRDAGQPPLFQVLFVLQEMSQAALTAGGVAMDVEPVDFAGAQFDLSLIVSPRGCRFEYSTDRFDQATIARLAAHFGTLLRGVVTAPDARVSELPLLTRAERHEVLSTGNDTASPYPHDRCVHELFERRAAEAPGALALLAGAEHVTYGELNQRANRLAHWLRGGGIGPDQLVGIAMERSVEMVVAIYGVLKAGGAYVPVDPGHPPQRTRHVLSAAGVRLLLTQERFRDVLAGAAERTLCLDTGWREVAACPAVDPAPVACPDSLAYVMHTSGSTGLPKGVMTTHRNLVDVMSFLQRTYRLAGDDRVLQHLPFSFDMSDGELFLPLVSGACAVLAPPGSHRDPDQLVAAIAQHSVTSVQFVPTVLGVLFERPGFRDCRSLRHVLSGGDALPSGLVNRLLREMPWVALHNFYGPTEATMGQTYWRCEELPEGTIAPIGTPIDNVSAHVLDRWLQPVPAGVSGELCLGGVTVARGYLRRPDLTAERFVPDPHGPRGARLYRTGDAARRRADGVLEFAGRIDHQVKLRGYRVEPAEVQAALDRHPAVLQSLVAVRGDGAGGPSLVAYVVPGAGARPSPAELRAAVRDWLPEYMVPAAFVVLDGFPLTPTGKVDRRALPTPEPERPAPVAVPRTAMERTVARAWRRALELDEVGLQDNFFDLGGHSLLLLAVHRELREELDRPIALVELFEHPTIGALAEHLSGPGGAGGDERAERARRRGERQRTAVGRLARGRSERGG